MSTEVIKAIKNRVTFLTQELRKISVQGVVQHEILRVPLSEGGVKLDDAGVVDDLEDPLLVFYLSDPVFL